MAPRPPSLAVAALALLALALPAAARTVQDVLTAVPDCAPFVAALRQYAPDAWRQVSTPAFAGSVLCPNAAALAAKPLPADPAAKAAILLYHVLPADALPPAPARLREGQPFVTLLANARVHASRRGGGGLAHFVGGDAPSALVPLPLDNTATVLGIEQARMGGKEGGSVALIDMVLTPPPEAVAAAVGASPAGASPVAAGAPGGAAEVSRALDSARMLAEPLPATMPPPATTDVIVGNSTMTDNSTNGTAAALGDGGASGNGTAAEEGQAGEAARVTAAGGSKLKKTVVRVIKRVLP
jgi:hypothetical protein